MVRYTGRMRRTRQSVVWTHFKLLNDNKEAKFTICGQLNHFAELPPKFSLPSPQLWHDGYVTL